MGARRLLCSVFVLVVGVLVFASAPALAAPFEAPELTVESVTASSATLHGVMNPLKASGAGTYEFIYKQGKAGCAGGTKVPVPAGMMTGTEHEEAYEGISNLAADPEYTTCLRAVNTTSVPSEEATSAAVTFTTAIPPETPSVISPVKAVTATSATLEGVLNPHAAGNAGSYEFLYRASATECEGGEASGGSALGGKGEAVKATVVLLPNTTYTFCLRAYNDAGEASAASSPVTFSTPVAAPVIESESSANVDASEARIEATVNPGNSETAYHFEYGPAAGSYDVSTPVREIPPAVTGVGVNVVLTGLTPGATYHYRVVASNALPGAVDGPDQSFTTPVAQGSGSPSACPNEQRRSEQSYGLKLPDCRAYEMVSPLETNGQDATDPFEDQGPRASVSGGAITYASRGSFGDPLGAGGNSQYLSRRGSLGWSTQNITTPQQVVSTELFISSLSNELFTPELTEGIMLANSQLTSEGAPHVAGSEYFLYLDDFASGKYHYLAKHESLEETPIAASADFSRVVVGRSEWVNGRPVPVIVGNDGKPIEGNIGSPGVIGRPPGEAPVSGDIWHAVSDAEVYFTSDTGSVLYVRENSEEEQSKLNGKEECVERAKACTIVVSASQKTNGTGPGGTALYDGVSAPRYWGASVDGSKAFFTSSAELTNNAHTGVSGEQVILVEGDNVGTGSYTLSFEGQTTGSILAQAPAAEVQAALEALSSIGSGNVTVTGMATSGLAVKFVGGLAGREVASITATSSLSEGKVSIQDVARPGEDLYEYDVETGGLRDLSPDPGEADGARVQGVVQISEDGSYVYFVADGALAGKAVAGEPNLYVSHDGGAPTFIATLGATIDRTDWDSNEQVFRAGPSRNSAVVTPDGRRLAFMSEESLTGYNNEQTEPGECEHRLGELDSGKEVYETGKCREVYLYDAETGSLVCASCDPSGARPTGASSLDTEPELEYRSRNLVEGGALFFNSSDALVPHASNGRQNVYEYEEGHLYPISNVAGGYESFFLDASANGENVFFGTADQLLPQDTSNNVVVWDARVGGGFPVTTSPPACNSGDSCKPPPAPQLAIFGAPSSATFSGPGNISPAITPPPSTKAKKKAVKCKKNFVKEKKGQCVKKRKKSKKAKKSAHTNRRASR